MPTRTSLSNLPVGFQHRDYANVLDLVILSNIENFNAEFIEQRLSQEERYEKLRNIILRQRASLESRDIRQLEK